MFVSIFSQLFNAAKETRKSKQRQAIKIAHFFWWYHEFMTTKTKAEDINRNDTHREIEWTKRKKIKGKSQIIVTSDIYRRISRTSCQCGDTALKRIYSHLIIVFRSFFGSAPIIIIIYSSRNVTKWIRWCVLLGIANVVYVCEKVVNVTQPKYEKKESLIKRNKHTRIANPVK